MRSVGNSPVVTDAHEIRRVTHEALRWAQDRGATDGQLKAIRKEISEAGYLIGRPRGEPDGDWSEVKSSSSVSRWSRRVAGFSPASAGRRPACGVSRQRAAAPCTRPANARPAPPSVRGRTRGFIVFPLRPLTARRPVSNRQRDSCGKPYPPPPGVSIRTTSPAFI